MKTKLLSFILTMMLFTSVSYAQTVWDFGNSPSWPVSPGYNANTVVNNLGFFPGTNITNIGEIEDNNSGAFSDGYSGTKRLKFNGSSYETGVTDFTMPTKRYFYFAVAGPVTVKVWFRTGGSGTRNVYLTNGTTILGSIGSSTSGDRLILNTAYTGGAANLYLTCDSSCNIMKIEVTGTLGTTTLSNNDFQTESLVNVFSNGKQISVSNVISNTQVDVYSITGSLVKSMNTSSDIDFQMETSGIYIINVNSAEGKKSVKIAIQ